MSLNRNEIPAVPPGVRFVVLDNGLTVIVLEDHSAPVVAAQVWCQAGSIDEGRWVGAGLSHVLEHMLFKGTSRRGPGRIDQEVQEAGGYLNAYTSFDRTVYWISVPNTGARVAIDVLCDIVQHATLPEEELAKEMDVIRREMDMGQDDPARRSSRRLFETAYTRSPYRYTTIGYLDIFNELRREDIVGYYREKYVPNNLFFVVAGDVKADEVIEQIRTAFADAKSRPLPPAVLPEEPRQLAPRELIEEAPVELVYLHFSWHIPDVRHPDVPVLDVLAMLLGGGRSSRLYQEVRERRGLVNSVEAWTYSPGNPGLFGQSAVLAVERLDEARAAMLAEIERMKSEPVSDAELQKGVKQFIAGTLSTRKTMQGQAQDLGACWMAAGDLNFSARYLAAVQRITPADLQRVAQQYLTTENRTQYTLVPNGSSPRRESSVETGADQPIRKLELRNGLRLLVKEDHHLPFVQFRLVVKGGVLAETAADNGVTQLLARMFLQGTTDRSAEAIATAIESVGGNLDTYSGNNSLGLIAEVLSSDFNLGLGLLAEVLLRPAFPAEALERERTNQLAALKAQRDQLLTSAFVAMRQMLFGPQGYGLNSLGTEESVANLSREHLVAQHRRLISPTNAVLAIYGDVQTDSLPAAVEAQLLSWTSHGPGETFVPVERSEAAAQRAESAREKKQAVVVVGFPSTTLLNPDRFALELLQEICSDLGSRLFLRIREKLGLAYYVGAQNFLGLVPGYFAFYAGTAPDKAELVERELLAEARTLATEGPTEDELNRAKAKVIGQRKIARQDLGSLAMTTALDELYGLGFNSIQTEDAQYEAITLDQLREVAHRYLQPDACVVAIQKGDGVSA